MSREEKTLQQELYYEEQKRTILQYCREFFKRLGVDIKIDENR